MTTHNADFTTCHCLNPQTVWYCGITVCKDGVTSPRLVFSEKEALKYFHGNYLEMCRHEHSLPCGKCLICGIRKRKDMATRLAHEQSMYDKCCFITLTYNDSNLPYVKQKKVWDDFIVDELGQKESFYIPVVKHRNEWEDVSDGVPSLFPRDVQLFIKRLRRHLEYMPKRRSLGSVRDHVDTPIRYFAVGEYGSKTKRPHYHIIIFGWSPSDKSFHEFRKKYTIYRSAQIEKLWTYGFSTVCEVNGAVARYCARYVTKKMIPTSSITNSDLYAPSPVREFVLQSVRNGGIGSRWFDKYGIDACETGVCSYRCGERTIKAPVPRYYMARLRKYDSFLWCELRFQRMYWLDTHGAPRERFSDLIAKAKVEEETLKHFRSDEVF